MALDAITISTIAAIASAVSAISAAVSAGVNYRNSNTFLKQLKNTTIDACITAALSLKSAVHGTLELKTNKEDPVKPEEIWAAYNSAWVKWVALSQAFGVAQRYTSDLPLNAPDELSHLLSKLRIDLRKPDFPSTADIRPKVDDIVKNICAALGAATV
jgi:hypothetical protein